MARAGVPVVEKPLLGNRNIYVREGCYNCHSQMTRALRDEVERGHAWDGIRELNKPLPRWWLWLFYLTTVWSVALIRPAGLAGGRLSHGKKQQDEKYSRHVPSP